MARARYPQQQPSTAYPGGGGPPQYGASAYSQPGYAPPPAYSPPPPVVMGQFCQTNMGVVVGPGPLKPVGSPCWVDTHWGRVFGQMIRM
jgi:hypothetical protein